jgi:hypothetical protein
MKPSDNGKLGESQGRKARGATVNDYASQLPKRWNKENHLIQGGYFMPSFILQNLPTY